MERCRAKINKKKEKEKTDGEVKKSERAKAARDTWRMSANECLGVWLCACGMCLPAWMCTHLYEFIGCVRVCWGLLYMLFIGSYYI